MKVDLGIWDRLTRVVMILIVVAGLIGIGIWYFPVIKHNHAMRKEILQYQNELRQEEERAKQLEAAIKALRHDPAAVERLAREKLGYVKPGESMIHFETVQTNRVDHSFAAPAP